MNRRSFLAATSAGALAADAARSPIQLHIELEVEAGKEAELEANFRNHFRPAIRKQPGFLDVKLIKLRKVLTDKLDGKWSYKLVLTFDTEEHRQAWAKTPEHEQAWPTIARTLAGRKARVILYDVIP